MNPPKTILTENDFDQMTGFVREYSRKTDLYRYINFLVMLVFQYRN